MNAREYTLMPPVSLNVFGWIAPLPATGPVPANYSVAPKPADGLCYLFTSANAADGTVVATHIVYSKDHPGLLDNVLLKAKSYRFPKQLKSPASPLGKRFYI